MSKTIFTSPQNLTTIQLQFIIDINNYKELDHHLSYEAKISSPVEVQKLEL